MFCSNCGKEIADTSTICPFCRESVTPMGVQAQGQALPAKKSRLPLILAGCAGLFAVVVLLVIFLMRGSRTGSGSGNYMRMGALIYTINVGEEAGVVFENGKEPIDFPVDGHPSMITYSFDRTAIAAVVRETDSGNGTLVYYGDGEITGVDDDVSWAAVAPAGKGAVYVKGSHEARELWIWDGEETMRLTRMYTPGNKRDYGGAVFSPDGTKLLYLEENRDGMSLMLYDGKESTEIETDDYLCPVMVSNDAKLVYYLSENRAGDPVLCLYDGKEIRDLSKVTTYTNYAYYYFNADATQLIFTDDKDDLRIVIGGGEPEKLAGSDFTMTAPVLMMRYATTNHETYAMVYGVKTFADTYYYDYSDGSFYRIGRDFKTEKKARRGTGYIISEDNRSVIYEKSNGDLVRLDLTGEKGEETVLFEDSHEWMSASLDNRVVVLMSEDHAVYYIDASGESVELTGKDGVDMSGGRYNRSVIPVLCYHMPSDTVFFAEQGVIYASEGGGVPEKVGGLEGDAYALYGNEFGVYIWTEGGEYDRLYYSADGVTFDLILDDVNER
ncbi:MAG: zinc ribbon domain-containing protein [Lachnospiraceae bacterium]|nr:zinc ribbon domain-containing protein [Lachnospiraceae bacterium]